MKIGIVGNGSDKFNAIQEKAVRRYINRILLEILVNDDIPTLVSGHSMLEGIDIWSEQEWDAADCPKDIQAPETEDWDDQWKCIKCGDDSPDSDEHFCPKGGVCEYKLYIGYKTRNLAIAKISDVTYVILSTKYPDSFTGMKFGKCYHCEGVKSPWQSQHPWHVKSGACWTGLRAHEFGHQVVFVFVNDDGSWTEVKHRTEKRICKRCGHVYERCGYCEDDICFIDEYRKKEKA